jgi:hypothetical protein
MKTLTFLFFSLVCFVAKAQNYATHYFQLQLSDAENLRPAPGLQVRCQCGNEFKLIQTDSLGRATLACESQQIKITLSGEFYKTQNNLVLTKENAHSQTEDTLRFQIFVQPKTALTTKEVEVRNPYQPQAIFASERLSVADFEILDDNRLLLLSYERKLNKGAELLLVDADEKVLFAKSLGGDAQHLLLDFRGFIHLMYKNRLDYVHLEDDAFALVPMDKAYYQRFVAPIIDTNKTKFYFTNYRETYPAADFFAYDELDSTYLKISSISDEIMMDMFIKEYLWVDTRTKLWAREMEQKTGIDKEDIVGEAIFTNSIFYKEIYAPMFLKNDTIYLFDFYKNYLRKYDRHGEKLDSIPITMHQQPKKTGWCNRLIQDAITGNIYAVFDKGGYTVIQPLQLKDGTLGLPIRLEFRYVDKLVIHNSAVYYTYRPFESIQKKYLYRQQLPLFFDENQTARDRRQ